MSSEMSWKNSHRSMMSWVGFRVRLLRSSSSISSTTAWMRGSSLWSLKEANRSSSEFS